MLHHIEIYVSALAASRDFWSGLLRQIDYDVIASWTDGFSLGRGGEPYLTFVQVAEKHAARPYHRCAVGLNHLAFKVTDRAAVDNLRNYCIKAGIPRLYEDRYPHANGGTNYYALFLEDPDRIKIEFVAA